MDQDQTYEIQTLVIGAGVIGLACARQLALLGHEVIIVDSASAFGTETSSRNSEVIHAGIYYPKDSLKARYCVEGKKKLYAYCEARNIPFKKIGKLIVATDVSELEALHQIYEKAKENNVNEGEYALSYLTQSQIQAYEPALKNVKAALWSPGTGIIDSHSLMQALLTDAENCGANLVLKTKVVGGEISDRYEINVGREIGGGRERGVGRERGDIRDLNDSREQIKINNKQNESNKSNKVNKRNIRNNKNIFMKLRDANNEEMIIKAQNVVNCAGLFAPALARSIVGMPADKIPKAYFCKGNYFTLAGKSPFRHLVYPIPNSAGLGVHVTLDLAGQARFGPDTEWISEINVDLDGDRDRDRDRDRDYDNLYNLYKVNLNRAKSFYESIRRYWPDLKDGDLHPGYVGIRPKIVDAKSKAGDFIIQGPLDHGIPGLVNLYGIESPGLTACICIAEVIAKELDFYR